MISNLRLAFRMLLRTPALTSIAILSLAIGIGANAAIFSLYNQMLLRPLPVRDPYQLVNLGAPGPKPGSQSSNQAGSSENVFSYPMFRDLEKAKTRTPCRRSPASPSSHDRTRTSRMSSRARVRLPRWRRASSAASSGGMPRRTFDSVRLAR